MTDNYKQLLEQVGIDLKSALDRFMGSEALYEKFLWKFLDDETYKCFEESINIGDVDKAFMSAHTMKGVAANMEIGSLLEVLVPITEQLRNGKLDGISEYRRELKLRYEKLCSVIRENR